MTTAEQLKTLTEKLAALEAKLKGASGSTAAGGSGSSPGEVTVKVPRERKLRMFTGVRDDHVIEDWILDTKRAISSQSEADAVDFRITTWRELPRRSCDSGRTRRKTPQNMYFRVLRISFGEGLTSTQAQRKFF